MTAPIALNLAPERGRALGTATKKSLDFRFHIMHLIGRITKTPRLTYTTGDKARVNFTLAIDGYNGAVDYVPLTAFGKLAETIHEHTDKGHLVAIEGRITSGKYTNDQGETVYTLDAMAGTCQFLSRPRVATTTPDSVDPEGEVA